MKHSTFIWLFFICGIAFLIFDSNSKSNSYKPTWEDYAICAGQQKYENKDSGAMLIKAYQFDVDIKVANKLMVSIYDELRAKKDKALSRKYFEHCERVSRYENN